MTIITTVGASYVEHMNDDHLAKMEGTCTFLRLISRLAVGWRWRVQENKRWKESALVRKCADGVAVTKYTLDVTVVRL